MNHQFTLVLTIYLIFSGFFVYAQNPYYINYDTNNGLPSSEVYSIHFTDDNQVWFSTDRGVAVYNGYEFSTLSTEDGLKTNTNFNIFEDSKHRLWFTGIDGSLSLYDKGNFLENSILDSLQTFVQSYFYHTPIENAKGQFLFYNRRTEFMSKMYILWDSNTGQLTPLTIEDLTREYLFKRGSELDLIKFGSTVFSISESIKTHKPLVKHTSDWIGSYYYHLFKINENGEVIEETSVKGRIDYKYVDRYNDLWVCSNLGLYYFKNADLSKEPQLFFPSRNVTGLKEDFEGNYWMTTGDEGVYFIPDMKIKTINFIDENSNSGRILSTAALDNRIYFGSYWGEIFSIDKNLKVDTIFNPYNQDAKNQNHAYKLKNTVYFCEHRIEEKKDGTCKILANRHHQYNMVIKEILGVTLELDRVTGYRILRKDESVIESFDIDPNIVFRIESVEEDKDGNVWIGTHEGAFVLKTDNNISISKATDHALTINQRINDIKSDEYDNLWFASIGHGLLYRAFDSIYHITEYDGLVSNVINCLHVQDSTTLWVGTNNGLNRISYSIVNQKMKINNIRTHGVLDGLPSNFINAIEYWNGYLWLATNEGITYIKPEFFKTDHPNIPIYLEELLVNDVARNPKNGLSLEAEENDISMQMTGVSYSKENTNDFYRYRLSESNEKSPWKYTNDRNIRYIDLPSGHYTFEAAAKNKSEEWSEKPIVLDFEIKPYFSQTLLFKLLIIGILLAALALLFLFRDLQLKRRNTLQQNLMQVQMKAKEYELMALRNQMNPHFVFNSLNAIQSYIFRKDPLKANYYLSKFSSLMRDSLEFSRLKFIGLNQEINFLQTYLELEQMRFPNTFEYDIQIDPNIPVKQYAVPSLLLQPVLENIVKHAFKEIDHFGLIQIKINELVPGKSLSVIIEDNGTGYEGDFFAHTKQKDQYKSLGLTIVKNQIDALNREAVNNRASFSISNLADADKANSGVRVSFKIPVKSLLPDLSNVTINNNPKN